MSKPLLDRVERLALKVAQGDDDKLVFVDHRGSFDCCSAGGLRAYGLVKFPPPRYVVVGTFPASASVPALAKALRVRIC